MFQMTEDNPDGDSIRNMLMSIKGQIEGLNKDNNEIKERIKNIEVTSAPPNIENDKGAASVNDMGFEPSDSESVNEENSDSEEHLVFETRIKTEHFGPDINSDLANKINDTLLKASNIQELTKLHENYPIPGNITALKTPNMNPEVKIHSISNTGHIENELTFVQKDIGCAVGMCANLLSDMRKKSYSFDRTEVFSKLNDITSLLSAAHKNVTFVRKINVKSLLKEDLQPLCTKKGTKERENNNFVFGDDMGKQAEEVKKLRNVVMKESNFKSNYKSKNGFGASKRGHWNQKKEKYQRYYKKNQNYHQGKKEKDKPKRQ